MLLVHALPSVCRSYPMFHTILHPYICSCLTGPIHVFDWSTPHRSITLVGVGEFPSPPGNILVPHPVLVNAKTKKEIMQIVF